MINIDYKPILKKFIDTIPAIVYGTERLNYILENIEKIDPKERLILKQLVDRMLTSMIERESSDIEIGGHGSAGYVWLRTFGKKERVKEFPQFTPDEAAVIIINLLNKNQRKFLSATKSLDFSYTFFYERKKVDARFRASAYFELETLALNLRAINSVIRPLRSLEFHPNVVKAMSHNYIKFGLSLVTGITGSGKSAHLMQL